jgi:hypothetical protein
MTAGEVFRRLTTVLEKAGIPYMLSGSFASAFYGATRSTQDIDLVIDATTAQLELLIQQLPAEHYYVDLSAALAAHGKKSLFNVIDLATGWKIDLIFRKARAFSEEEFGRRRRINLQGIPIFVASPEDVVLSKLEWARLSQSQRQIEDAVAILRSRWESLDRDYLKKWIEALHLSSEWNTVLEKAKLSE